jgi:alpha-galactosidase
MEQTPLEAFHLERSWLGINAASERFGQVGSTPTNGFFPFVAFEDDTVGVIWGAQFCHPGSWQMEMYRRDDFLSISGGLADREFGH